MGGVAGVDFVILGAQKSATTELVHTLAGHPQVSIPLAEQPFFRDPYYRQRGVAAFLAQLPQQSAARHGIKCPDYLGHPEVAPRLARDLGAPDLVVCLRDPVQRAVSAYYWFVRWGVLPLDDIEVGLGRLLDHPEEQLPVTRSILEYGLYGRHLSHYLEHFPESSLHVLTHDALVADFEGTIQQLADFLGLDPWSTEPHRRRSNASVFSPARLRLLRLRNRYVVEVEPDGTDARIVLPTTPGSRFVSKAVAGLDRLALARVVSNRPPALSAATRRRLEDYYADDLDLLGSILTTEEVPWLVPA